MKEVINGVEVTMSPEREAAFLAMQAADKAALAAIDFDAQDTATLNAILLQPGSLDRAELRTLFNHENRLRALEGKAAITQGQFVTALKALIR